MPNLVKVVKAGERVQEVALEDGSTVRNAIKLAKKEVENHEVRLNGKPTNLDAPVRDNDIVSLVPKIQGGRRR